METLTEQELKQISKTIEESKFFKKFAYKGTWMSGSSTIVYPITIWRHDIEIQMDYLKSYKGRAAAFRSLLNKLQKDYPNMVGRFVKRDGSCPDIYSLYFK